MVQQLGGASMTSPFFSSCFVEKQARPSCPTSNRTTAIDEFNKPAEPGYIPILEVKS